MYVCMYVCMYMYTHIYIHIYIYIYLYISGNIGGQSLCTPTGAISWDRGYFFDFGGFAIKKTVRSSASRDGSPWAGSNTAIESFWRCIFVEIWPFLWSIGVPGGLRGGPGGSQARPWGSQGRAGGPRGVPGPQGRAQGIPGIPGVSGDIPGIPRILSMKRQNLS